MQRSQHEQDQARGHRIRRRSHGAHGTSIRPTEKRVRICCCPMKARTSLMSSSVCVVCTTALAALLAGTSGCMVFVHLPVTPGLENLSEAQVFAMAPPPEWPAPQADNPQTASVDVACGIGPRLSTGQLYAAVSVKGRPAPRPRCAPLNVALVLDRSGSMHGEPFRNMLLAAETFVGQLRDGDRLSLVAFSDGVYLAVPPRRDRRATRATSRSPPSARWSTAAGRTSRAACSPAWPRCSAPSSPGRSIRSSCSPTASPTSASPARAS